MRKETVVAVLIVLLGLVMALTAITGRFYNTRQNAGVAWGWGGLEVRGVPGLFFCPAEWNQFPYRVGSPWGWLAPIWGLLPVADC